MTVYSAFVKAVDLGTKGCVAAFNSASGANALRRRGFNQKQIDSMQNDAGWTAVMLIAPGMVWSLAAALALASGPITGIGIAAFVFVETVFLLPMQISAAYAAGKHDIAEAKQRKLSQPQG